MKPAEKLMSKEEVDFGGHDSSRAMRARSGEVDDRRVLVCLLYLLMRDGHVSPGQIETSLDQCTASAWKFSNGWLAKYAQDIAERVTAERGPQDTQ